MSKTHQNTFQIRQLNGNNDHPTPAQFLAAVNALAFCNLAKPLHTGNCSLEVVSSLFGHNKTVPKQRCPGPIDALDQLMDKGSLDDAETALNALLPADHASYIADSSLSRLDNYVAGCVARKMLQRTGCTLCTECLTTKRAPASLNEHDFICRFDCGGLICPSGVLAYLITT